MAEPSISSGAGKESSNGLGSGVAQAVPRSGKGQGKEKESLGTWDVHGGPKNHLVHGVSF